MASSIKHFLIWQEKSSATSDSVSKMVCPQTQREGSVPETRTLMVLWFWVHDDILVQFRGCMHGVSFHLIKNTSVAVTAVTANTFLCGSCSSKDYFVYLWLCDWKNAWEWFSKHKKTELLVSDVVMSTMGSKSACPVENF